MTKLLKTIFAVSVVASFATAAFAADTVKTGTGTGTGTAVKPNTADAAKTAEIEAACKKEHVNATPAEIKACVAEKSKEAAKTNTGTEGDTGAATGNTGATTGTGAATGNTGAKETK